jgi:hypothetical protein
MPLLITESDVNAVQDARRLIFRIFNRPEHFDSIERLEADRILRGLNIALTKLEDLCS